MHGRASPTKYVTDSHTNAPLRIRAIILAKRASPFFLPLSLFPLSRSQMCSNGITCKHAYIRTHTEHILYHINTTDTHTHTRTRTHAHAQTTHALKPPHAYGQIQAMSHTRTLTLSHTTTYRYTRTRAHHTHTHNRTRHHITPVVNGVHRLVSVHRSDGGCHSARPQSASQE